MTPLSILGLKFILKINTFKAMPRLKNILNKPRNYNKNH